jgi:CRP/FNR family cyclic AMP-dependent transcriptional regulator
MASALLALAHTRGRPSQEMKKPPSSKENEGLFLRPRFVLLAVLILCVCVFGNTAQLPVRANRGAISGTLSNQLTCEKLVNSESKSSMHFLTGEKRDQFEMKKNSLDRQHEASFTILRTGLSHLNLPMELVDELIERHIPVAFKKGELALCEGNTDGMLACILSGYIYVYCSPGDGNRTMVRMAGPGEVIGYPDYIDEKGRQARLFEAQVASKCTLALFSREHVAGLLAGLPAAALISLLAYLNTFWSENLRRFTVLLSLPFWDRLLIVMSDLAKRAGIRDSQGIMLIPEIGHQELAEMIGCSRPLVTCMIAEMVKSGLLARRKKQYVLLQRWDSNHNSGHSQKPIRRFDQSLRQFTRVSRVGS